jgi:hypothetical protein
MVLTGFELSDDEELPDEQDPGQSAYEDNECGRRQVLKERASQFSRSFCETLVDFLCSI